jgi:hypothetical protein
MRKARKVKTLLFCSLRSLRKTFATFAVNGFQLFQHPHLGRGKKDKGRSLFFCISGNPFYLCPHKSNIPSIKGCLIFIKKGEEIRLRETLATNPEIQENGAKT